MAAEDFLTFPPVFWGFFLRHGKSITRNTKCGISASFRLQLTWQIYEGREAGEGDAAYKYRVSRGGFSEVSTEFRLQKKEKNPFWKITPPLSLFFVFLGLQIYECRPLAKKLFCRDPENPLDIQRWNFRRAP